MYYYIIGDKICCSFNGNLSYEKAEMPHPGTPLTFLFEREPGTGRESFKVNSPLLLFQEAECFLVKQPEAGSAGGDDEEKAGRIDGKSGRQRCI